MNGHSTDTTVVLGFVLIVVGFAEFLVGGWFFAISGGNLVLLAFVPLSAVTGCYGGFLVGKGSPR